MNYGVNIFICLVMVLVGRQSCLTLLSRKFFMTVDVDGILHGCNIARSGNGIVEI